ncbi:phosphatidylserine decarboxylase [Capronia epimyces CBS 606.96]|uniref:phosphatidylserine decarboxylase n=1 Tax=Capronia epimyces CBS 606.96 TaxID=1182542 RepID=W9YUP9_9EURO|nr:phosphatidylserine decarboxylase [Capronia epimyces CBS 606.96]EXJ92976.1 phosphatidylserine decarboxylase [Capronia epimyces CBS 606.96]
MYLIDLLHRAIDHCLSQVKLVQNREIGWQTVDRKTGKPMREQQPIFKKLKLLFLFSRLVEWIDVTKTMRLWIHDKTIREGKAEGTPASASRIKPFVDFYHIDMDEFDPSDIQAYGSFEDFFVRKHKPGSRPVFAPNDPTKAVAVADARLVVYPTVSETRRLWIKGHNFTIANLIKDDELAQSWVDGAVASFRLSPQDYHRYHSPVTGTVSWYKQIPGQYYQVDPVCLQSDVDILTENARCCVCLDTREFGKVLFVAIGATNVGTVDINRKCQTPGSQVDKGDEVGLFQFGGSSIIVAFEAGRIEFDADLLEVSRRPIMMDVEVGMSLGEAR